MPSPGNLDDTLRGNDHHVQLDAADEQGQQCADGSVEDVRRADQLDETAADMLARQYV